MNLRTVAQGTVIGVIIFLILALIIGVTHPPLTISNYQGLHPSYDSLDYTPPSFVGTPTYKINNTDYTNLNPSCNKCTYINYATFQDAYMQVNTNPLTYNPPVLYSTQSDITPNQAAPSQTWQIKVGTSQQTLPNGTVVTTTTWNQYELDQYQATYHVNIWIGPGTLGDTPNTLTNSIIWVKLTPINAAPFTGAQNTYFAPAYIAVAQSQWIDGISPAGTGGSNVYAPPSASDQIPAATGTPLSICLQNTVANCNAKNYASQVPGMVDTALNPQVFAPVYFVPLNVASIAARTVTTCSWLGCWAGSTTSYYYPGLSISFQFNLFVIGQWQVQLLTSQTPTWQGQGGGINNQTYGIGSYNPFQGFFDWAAGFVGFLGTPVGIFLTFLLIGVIAVVIIVVSIAFAGLFLGRGRKK